MWYKKKSKNQKILKFLYQILKVKCGVKSINKITRENNKFINIIKTNINVA